MMVSIHVSNSGDDANDGSREKPVYSWARLRKLCTGNHEMVLMEGQATLNRLSREINLTGPDDTGETWSKTLAGDQGGPQPSR
jgi:hypothetical protein